MSIIDRIEQQLGLPGLAMTLANAIEPADLNSLLLEVHRLQAGKKAPPTVLADYESNRFVRNATTPPKELHSWSSLVLDLLPGTVELVELSPVCPLGSCSAVAGVTQDWAIGGGRGIEVVSDPTNVLALELARRRKATARLEPRSQTAIHLATIQRVVRAQQYRSSSALPHFSMFAMASASRDRGSFLFEMDAIVQHLGFHLMALERFLGPSIALGVEYTILDPSLVTDQRWSVIEDQLHAAMPGVAFRADPDRSAGRNYYRSVCFHIIATMPDGETWQLGDGGAVDWASRLLSNAKERLFISGVGIEGLCTLRAQASA